VGLWFPAAILVPITILVAFGELPRTWWVGVCALLALAMVISFAAGRAYERLGWLDRIMIRCPSTQRLVKIGIAPGAKAGEETSDFGRRELICPECNHLHFWTTVHVAEPSNR